MQDFDVVGRIQELCHSRAWTYYRLAKESGIPYSTLSTMLRKTNVPSVTSLVKICHGFGITLSQFFSENDMVELTPELKNLFDQWLTLTPEQKDAVYRMIKAFDNS